MRVGTLHSDPWTTLRHHSAKRQGHGAPLERELAQLRSRCSPGLDHHVRGVVGGPQLDATEGRGALSGDASLGARDGAAVIKGQLWEHMAPMHNGTHRCPRFGA
jgi:hypothetical protein